ncbi:hypothetical protein QKW35_08505 [Pontibacterium granulatum]|nr:hypothetical protein [Pontibacterium granulatum]MDI3324414.1 hypothetical protein [Pontibacterium granulatum]
MLKKFLLLPAFSITASSANAQTPDLEQQLVGTKQRQAIADS